MLEPEIAAETYRTVHYAHQPMNVPLLIQSVDVLVQVSLQTTGMLRSGETRSARSLGELRARLVTACLVEGHLR